MAKLNGVKTVDMVNGEITKVSYRGAEYTLVSSDEFGIAKLGDIVLITDDSWWQATEGEFYATVGLSNGNPRIIDDEDTTDSNFYDGSYELFRKKYAKSSPTIEDVNAKVDVLADRVTALENPAPLKVGDYAKVVGNSHSNHFGGKDGDIVKLVQKTDDGSYFRTETLDGGNFNGTPWALKTALVHATDEEVATAKAQAEADAIERKRNEIFTANGRKVGEFRKGDIVRVSTRADAHKVAGKLVTIAGFKDSNRCGGLAWFEDYGHSITGQYLEPIAFAESRLDR